MARNEEGEFSFDTMELASQIFDRNEIPKISKIKVYYI